jgi:ABC-type transporter Mla subunit MlaD
MFVEGSQTLASVTRLATSLQAAVDRLERSGAIDDLGATLRSTRGLAQRLEGLSRDGTLDDLGAMVRSGRRIAEQVERGSGWLHALIYEEPEALRRLNTLLAGAQDVLERTPERSERGGVLLSAEAPGRPLPPGRHGGPRRSAERAPGEEGLLSALLFDPQYRSVASDLQAVTRSLRDVTERVSRGQGLLGSLVSDRPDEPMGQAAADFRQAMANLRAITDRLRAGEGTLGGFLEDPTVYENLAAFLEGAERSMLLRALIRSTITSGAAAPPASGGKR